MSKDNFEETLKAEYEELDNIKTSVEPAKEDDKDSDNDDNKDE